MIFGKVCGIFVPSDPFPYQRVMGKYSGNCHAKFIRFQSHIRSLWLMDCPCWDMHVQKIWASETKPKASFIDLKIVANRIWVIPGLYFKCLGLVYWLSSQRPSYWHLFHWNGYCSFRDIVPSNYSKMCMGDKVGMKYLNNTYMSGEKRSQHAKYVLA